ncbi:MAG: hypothetical protein LBR09_00845 [Endomicrobium sp.]|nr:hypothetical protein [Endomicrobium sp.]
MGNEENYNSVDNTSASRMRYHTPTQPQGNKTPFWESTVLSNPIIAGGTVLLVAGIIHIIKYCCTRHKQPKQPVQLARQKQQVVEEQTLQRQETNQQSQNLKQVVEEQQKEQKRLEQQRRETKQEEEEQKAREQQLQQAKQEEADSVTNAMLRQEDINQVTKSILWDVIFVMQGPIMKKTLIDNEALTKDLIRKIVTEAIGKTNALTVEMQIKTTAKLLAELWEKPDPLAPRMLYETANRLIAYKPTRSQLFRE